MDPSEKYVAPATTRLTAVMAQILASARGLRKAVSAHPGQRSVAMLRIGPFKCALTLEGSPCALLPWSLHLSVSNSLALGRLANLEEVFLVSLFFSPDERPSLTREEGHAWPETHFRLGCVSPDVTTC